MFLSGSFCVLFIVKSLKCIWCFHTAEVVLICITSFSSLTRSSVKNTVCFFDKSSCFLVCKFFLISSYNSKQKICIT